MAVTLVAGVIAIVSVSRAGQTYQASASILVTPLPVGSSAVLGIGTVVDTGNPGQDVQTAAALIDSQEAGAAAAAQLGPPWTAGGVLSAVTVTPVGAADVLDVTASASTASDAARIANAFAKSAIAHRASVVQGQINRTLTALEARLATLPAASAEAQAVAGQVAQLRTIQGTGREPTMSISQLAVPPGSPTGTAPWLIVLLAMIGGVILGSVAALGLEAFSRPVRDGDELAALYQLPVLASIPRIRGRRRHRLAPWELSSVGFEQIRMLRVQLSLGSPGPVIMVTSAGAGDGKTTVAASLAAAYAEAHQDVILIDLDTRKPDLMKVLGIEHAEVDRTNGLDAALVAVPRLPRVRVLPAPPGGPMTFEALLRRLPDQLAEARRSASCVIIDTAPIGEVSDALRVAPLCDQVVLVGRPGHTDRRRLRVARDMLARAHARTVGLVLVGDEWAPSGNEYGYGYSTGLSEILDEPEEAERASMGLSEILDESDEPKRSSTGSTRRRDVEAG
jgi:Mrp family chromosome partitioning ATPase/capsular polysaccharide biosynthesis protein